MCSEHNKTTILHLIRILRKFRSTEQAPLIGENSKGYLSSGMSPERVDIFLVDIILVSSKNNDDKLEISNLYVVCVSYHSLPNILKNMQICAKRKAIKQ